jgi:hypothetical protein
MPMASLEGAWGIHLECHQFRRLFVISRNLFGGSLSAASNRAWAQDSTHHSWLSSHRSWGVDWFSEQSAVALVFCIGCSLRPEGRWIAFGASGPSLFRRDFAVMGHIARSVTSELHIFVSHRSRAFLRVIHLNVFATQLTPVLCSGSLVSWHNFLASVC